MTIVRKMLLATGAAAAISGAASAQLFDSGSLGNISGGPASPINNWATANNLSTVVPTGTYTNYLVVTEWGNTNTVGNQWSNEARVFLGLAPANLPATGGVSGAPTNPAASQRITSTYVAATNSLGSGSSGNLAFNRLQYWTGTMLGTGTGIGNFAAPTTVYVGAGQSFSNAATSANARWNNVRVIMNYNSVSTATVTTTLPPSGSGWNAPASFTDLGTLGEGRQNLTWNTSATAPQAWFRFVLPVGVSSGFGLLDLDTEQNGTAAPSNTDSQITLFRSVSGSGGTLVQDGPGLGTGADATNTWADDDSGSGLFSQLSYGNTATDAPVGTSARAYGVATGGTAYNGRDGALAAGEYWVMVSHFSGAGANNSTTPTITVTGQTFTDLGSGNYQLTTNQTSQVLGQTIGSSTTFITNGSLNIAFVPTPGAAALLGLGGLMATRRRRA